MWTSVLLASAGCYALKLLGLSVPPRVLDDRRVRHVGSLLPIAMLSAFIATQTFGDGTDLAFDARVAGVAMAAVCVWRRLPFLVVIVAACAATALVRLAA